MIKITKKPFIIENTDKWGRSLGTYYVNNCVGYVEESFWAEIYEFENYSKTIDGAEELKKISFASKDEYFDSDIQAPVMKRLLERAHSTIWQFNMRVNEKDVLVDGFNENEYTRSYAIFDDCTFHVWTSSHDEEVLKLQEQCDQMNSKAKS